MNGERSAAFAGLRRAEEVRDQRSDRDSQLSTLNPQPSLELRIEELVLHGFAPGDRYTIRDTVEQELARLLGEQGVPNSLRVQRATDEIKGATFNAPHNAKPLAISQQIAQALYQAFSRPVAAGADRGLNGQLAHAPYQGLSL